MVAGPQVIARHAGVRASQALCDEVAGLLAVDVQHAAHGHRLSRRWMQVLPRAMPGVARLVVKPRPLAAHHRRADARGGLWADQG